MFRNSFPPQLAGLGSLRSGGLAVLLALPGLLQAAAVTVQALDPAGKPLAGAVVAIEVGGVAKAAAPGTRAEISQRQRSFEP
ncbi:MAG: hypothetical protein RLZZ373_301, partial [Pseudomonadota bacterium]